MSTTFQKNLASDHLNMIRGLAAIAVLVYHVRYRLFLDYADLIAPGVAQKFFYALTAFGHDAVMVFFVLSGYFISATVIRDCKADKWSWKKFMTNRLVRLQLVLLPGLLLTMLWDGLGLALFKENAVYSGAPQIWRHDFFPVAARLDLPTFLGNALFLQNIVVAPFGSNDPLWSLSYEFWYYVLFPCVWLALAVRRTPVWQRAAYLGMCLILLPMLGRAVAFYFPIWLLGMAVGVLPRISWIQAKPTAAWLAGFIVFAGVLGVTHVASVKQLLGNSLLIIDYANGLSFSLFLYLLLHGSIPSAQGRYASLANAVAGFSYTLYVVHMPALICLRAFLIPDRPWTPDALTMGAAALISFATIGYAWVISRFTEAKTDSVRQWFLKALTFKRVVPESVAA